MLADIAGIAGNDIDDSGEGVGTVGSRCRATGDFDALHIADVHGHVVPVHPRQTGLILAAAVQQHQHAARIPGLGAVVGHRGYVAIYFDRGHARHQPQHLVEFPGAAGFDQVTVDDGDTGGRFRLGLADPGWGQHHCRLIGQRHHRLHALHALRTGQPQQALPPVFAPRSPTFDVAPSPVQRGYFLKRLIILLRLCTWRSVSVFLRPSKGLEPDLNSSRMGVPSSFNNSRKRFSRKRL